MLIKILVVICFISCQEDKKDILETEKYSISYPIHLELDQSGQDGTSFILKTEKENESDTFIENINLVVSNVGKMTFNQLSNKAIEDITNVANIVEKRELNINGTNCFKLVFEITQNNVGFTVIQHYFLEEQTVYLLTFTSETSRLDKYLDEVNQVLSSFKLNKTQ